MIWHNLSSILPFYRWRLFALFLPILVLFAALTSLSGCGYTTKPLFPQDVKTVQVGIFANHTFYRGVEFDLTEALIKEIELRTPYKAVSGGPADTQIEGKVVSVTQSLLSRRRDGGLPQEMEVQLMIDFTWNNLRTGKPITDRKGLVVVGRYVPPVGEGLNVGQHEVAAKMATQIVNAMQGQW